MISIYIKNFFYILRVKWLVKNGCRHNCFLCRYSYECFTQLMYEKEGVKMSDEDKFRGLKEQAILCNEEKYGKEIREKYGKRAAEELA